MRKCAITFMVFEVLDNVSFLHLIKERMKKVVVCNKFKRSNVYTYVQIFSDVGFCRDMQKHKGS